ncbi:hypothetical protein HAPAU_12070 [Halalkalicoccus paucihalophilus]|jgi:hypothetical protein|uniref:Uncharacterized protein n=1 Tax=Halalkalicoccus paucihalophilus TaxID=1008153 RepID=A0A151AEW0_9EURY|nr:hypothetical protein [Halalkalicoccus paucihalophilus]KYH26115.1 hypothetical protein HAPAU_12070 [Halalkalicoccus paucihalophilus]
MTPELVSRPEEPTATTNDPSERGTCPYCGATAINVQGLLDCPECGF